MVALLLPAAVGLVFLYYLLAWYLVGRDPERQPIMVRYEAPEGICPATLRYLFRSDFDLRVFGAALFSLAEKRCLRIVRNAEGGTVLDILEPAEKPILSPAEALVWETLRGYERIPLGAFNERLHQCARNLMALLGKQAKPLYFVRNTRYLGPGLLLSAAVLVLAFTQWTYLDPPDKFDPDNWLLVLFAWVEPPVLLVMGGMFLAALRSFARRPRIGKFVTILMLLPVVGMVLAVLVGVLVAMFATYWPFGALNLALLVMPALFYLLLPRLTPLGRQILDQAEGYRRFLAATEQERLSFLHPPERTPEFVNHHFAYAYALDCELAWGQALGGVLGDTLESFGSDDDIPSASRLIPSCTTSPFAGLPEDFDRAFGDAVGTVGVAAVSAEPKHKDREEKAPSRREEGDNG